MIDPGLENKVALVTGANHGIGAASAAALAEQGASVFLTFLRLDPETYGRIDRGEAQSASEPGRGLYYRFLSQSADAVLSRIRSFRGRAESLEADLTDPGSIPLLFDRAEETFGPVDILVNNAAHDQCDTFLPESEIRKNPLFVEEYPLSPISAESASVHFAINSGAPALLMAEFARRALARNAGWGRIINISTEGAPGHAANISYGASKNALESYSRAAAVELGPFGITVNVISPGAVQTGWVPPDLEKRLREQYPLRRIGKPGDIADAVVFFASLQADWITGQVLYVGGGNRM